MFSGWFKLSQDLFRNVKIKMILKMENGMVLVFLWIALLAYCSREDNDGVLMFTENKPHTAATLAVAVDVECTEELMAQALDVFQEYEMVKLQNDVYIIPDWEFHQERIKRREEKEKDATRKRDKRTQKAFKEGKKKYANQTRAEMGTSGDGECVDPRAVMDLYHELCPNSPKCKSLTASRRDKIQVLADEGYSMADFRELFEQVSKSPFLLGKNDRNKPFAFDWFLDPDHAEQVRSGKYQKWTEASKPTVGPLNYAEYYKK